MVASAFLLSREHNYGEWLSTAPKQPKLTQDGDEGLRFGARK
jgi:hypothetical protein